MEKEIQRSLFPNPGRAPVLSSLPLTSQPTFKQPNFAQPIHTGRLLLLPLDPASRKDPRTHTKTSDYFLWRNSSVFIRLYTLPLEKQKYQDKKKGKTKSTGWADTSGEWRGNERDRERADPTIVTTPQNVVAEGNCVFSASSAGSHAHSGAAGPGQNTI
jgi:hypothetical protein